MNEEEALEQLYSLIDERKAFITENPEDNEIFRRDLVALETIIDSYQHDKICLSGYRESILRRPATNLDFVEYIIEENHQLKESLKQRDEVIDECIESIQNFMTRIDEGFCADMMTFIDILQKYKGDNNE